MNQPQTPAVVKEFTAWYLDKEELKSLPEYSGTIPTGTTIGKTWKCNIFYDIPHLYPVWIICRYAEHPNPTKVAIQYFQARLKGQRIKAISEIPK